MSDYLQSALFLEIHEVLWHCQESLEKAQAAMRTLSKLVVRAAHSQPSHSEHSTLSDDYLRLSAASQRQLDPSSYSEGPSSSSAVSSVPSTPYLTPCLGLDEMGLC